MYLTEETKQRAKIEAMKKDGLDEADVKKQIEVLNDTLTVIPDTRQRLQNFCQELRNLLDEEFPEAATGEAPEGEEESNPLVSEARQLLRDAGIIFGTAEDDQPTANAPGVADDAGGTGGTGGTTACDEF